MKQKLRASREVEEENPDPHDSQATIPGLPMDSQVSTQLQLSPIPKDSLATGPQQSPIPKDNVATNPQQSPVPKDSMATALQQSPIPKDSLATGPQQSPIPIDSGSTQPQQSLACNPESPLHSQQVPVATPARSERVPTIAEMEALDHANFQQVPGLSIGLPVCIYV